ncbi:glycosidase [Arthrobacter oryzae]|uniref:Glycosidase n=1 Tax=Arthrobacter oryzae TaxID=409290 RepID=A0A3N0C3J1_9MICC|nr:glycosidase [Arthrobacter oryzae]RNL57142.1 glycosidase [Arthrobacter oryzae]
MATNTAENTTLRLKAVLDVLSEAVQSSEKLNAGDVLGAAIAKVPLNDQESELLSGGIPRGHKTLTTATAKLVKAGWLVKGRPGWSITEDGQRATVAFADPAAFAAALDAGTPVPAGTELPTAPAAKAAPKAAAKAAPKRKKAEAAPAAEAASAAPVAETQDSSAEAVDQPDAVAVVGDFNTLLGAPENWSPEFDEVQMKLDSADQLWKLEADIPAGFYNFKIALNRSWAENFGAFGLFDGPNHELHHDGGRLVIHYNHRTRDIVLA